MGLRILMRERPFFLFWSPMQPKHATTPTMIGLYHGFLHNGSCSW